MSALRRKAMLACCFWLLAVHAQALDRVRGEGRALVLEQDVAAAQRAALAEALRDASVKQGAVINASSVVTEQGGLEERTVVHSTQKMLNYEVISASVTDGVAETSIAAVFDQGTRACATHRLGGAIDVTVASSSKGIPLDAAGVRGTSAYEATLERRVFDALKSSANGTPFVFRKPVTSAYQQLTVPERESRAPRGSLRVAVTLNAQSSTRRREVARALIVTTDATFEDGFSGETQTLPPIREALAIDAQGQIAAPRFPVLLAEQLQMNLCMPPQLSLAREGEAFAIAAGSRHGLSAGALLEARTARGEQLFFTASKIEPLRAVLQPLGPTPAPGSVTQVTLVSTGT
jgi:hypothetical protein